MFGRRGKRAYTIDEIAERVRPVAEEYCIDSIHVFGSYAKGTANSDSDVDLWVSGGDVEGIRIGGLYLELRNALGKEIDLITDEADPRFMSIIRKDAVRIYRLSNRGAYL